MKEELYVIIDGERKQLDLNAPSGITLNYQSNVLSDFDVVKREFSYTFTLPYTLNNRKVFGLCAGSASQMGKTYVFDAEYWINGVSLFASLDLYIQLVDNTKGYECKIVHLFSAGERNFFDKDIKLRELGRFLEHDYEGSVFGAEEKDMIISPDFNITAIGITEDKGVYEITDKSIIAPMEDYETLKDTPYMYAVYGAGAGITENTHTTAQGRGRTQVVIYTPFRLGFDDLSLELYEDDTAIRNVLLNSPVVAPMPYVFSCIEKAFGITLDFPKDEVKKYCLPFVKMGQTECLRQQNYIDLSLSGYVLDMTTPMAKEEDSMQCGLLFDTFSVNNSVTGKEFKAQRLIGVYADTRDNGFWGTVTGAVLGSVFGVMGAVYGAIAGNVIYKYGASVKVDDSKTGIALAIKGGMGSIYHLSGCIKVTLRFPNVRIDQLADYNKMWNKTKPKITVFAIPIPNELKLSGSFDFDDTSQAIVNPIYSWWKANDPKREQEIEGVIVNIRSESTAINSSTYYVDYVFEMRTSNGGENVTFKSFRATDNGCFLHFNLGLSDFQNFDKIDISSEELRIYTGDTEELSPSTIGSAINYYNNFPDVTCKEVVTSMLKVLGGGCVYDENTRTLRYVSCEMLMDSVDFDIVRDWSRKLVFKGQAEDFNAVIDIKTKVDNVKNVNYYLMANEKIDDYGQIEKNDLDEDWYKQNGACIILHDDVDIEFATINLPFYGAYISNKNARGVYTGETLKYWDFKGVPEGNALTTVKPVEAKPIIGEFCWKEADKSKNKYYLSLKAWQFPADMSDLKPYGILEDIYRNSIIIEEYMELSEFDLRDLDYTVPIYLDKYNAYFGIVEIERYDDGVCKVILFKLPIKP